MAVDLCMPYGYNMLILDDLDLDARLQFIGKGKKSALTWNALQLGKQ